MLLFVEFQFYYFCIYINILYNNKFFSILNSLSFIMKEHQRVLNSSEILKKKASNANNEYMRLLKEKDESTLDQLGKENKELKKKLEKMEQEIQSIKKQVFFFFF